MRPNTPTCNEHQQVMRFGLATAISWSRLFTQNQDQVLMQNTQQSRTVTHTRAIKKHQKNGNFLTDPVRPISNEDFREKELSSLRSETRGRKCLPLSCTSCVLEGSGTDPGDPASSMYRYSVQRTRTTTTKKHTWRRNQKNSIKQKLDHATEQN